MEMINDMDILTYLHSILRAQGSIRRGTSVALLELKLAYEFLPKRISKRLTELPPGIVGQARLPLPAKGAGLEELMARLTTDAAVQQVIRAANVYRARLRYPPLSMDGWLKGGGP
ncbi:MAG: translation initiation factor IF-2 [Oscillospiraceae bacterium]|nr:translation initiation factor IF-2 [Oscillospiraceae bacterium]